MVPEKLTVLIPCKNESRNIRDCIESVRDLADEILVADCFSSDETLDIVDQTGICRVIQREFVNFSDFKNWAIPQARHPWVLILDADERVTCQLASEIKEVLTQPPDNIDAWFIPRQWYFMGHPVRFSGWQTDKLLRLIRKNCCRYRSCRVHEEIVFDRRRVRNLSSRLLHYSYTTYDDLFYKQVRYCRWAAQDLWDEGRKSTFYGLFVSPFLRFLQLYLFRLGFLDGAVGFQLCILMAFNSFAKQARLWEREHGMAPLPAPICDAPEEANTEPLAAARLAELAYDDTDAEPAADIFPKFFNKAA